MISHPVTIEHTRETLVAVYNRILHKLGDDSVDLLNIIRELDYLVEHGEDQ